MAESQSQSPSSRSPSSMETNSSQNLSVTILKTKSVYSYTIPSFCAIKMDLQQISLRDDVDEESFDGFIRVEKGTAIQRPLPSRVCIKSACLVPEDEFVLEINIQDMEHDPRGVFVIYEWDWLTEVSSDTDVITCGNLDFSYSSASSRQLSPHPSHVLIATSDITHVIVFKCIGATRDKKQQEALEKALCARENGESVPVKIEPEPTNPYDSKAICFKCQVEGTWCRIGYIVREVLDEVHQAIRENKILYIQFAWVKFLLHWTRCGPGFYAGVYIARKGEWSQRCVRAASTK